MGSMFTLNAYKQYLTFEHLKKMHESEPTANHSIDTGEMVRSGVLTQEVLDMPHSKVVLWHISRLNMLIRQELDSAVVNKDKAQNALLKDIRQIRRNFNLASLPAHGKQVEEIASVFINDAKTLIHKYALQHESDFRLAPLWKNILLLFSVVGTIPALFSIGSKIVTGHYTFFDGKGIEEHRLNEQVQNLEHCFKKQVVVPTKPVEEKAQYAPVQSQTNTGSAQEQIEHLTQTVF